MNTRPDEAGSRPCWFVGVAYGGTDDQMPRFLAEGIWETGYEDKYADVVNSILTGDRIAIKSTYVRKRGLPFDNRGHAVSVMAVKATGTVTENLGNGRSLRVDWTQLDSPREWYFYTYRSTVWPVSPGNWKTDALIEFTFNEESQDINRFRNAPYWRERFGDAERRFEWTQFYEAVADKLLPFKDNRAPLIEGIHAIAERVEGLGYLQDHYADGTSGPLRDICPFTTIGIFNRGIKDINRKTIALELSKLLGVNEAVPESFEGIPVLNNMQSWYFSHEKDRQPDDIDALWEIFAASIRIAESDDAKARSAFIKAFDNTNSNRYVAWKLTFGLYWVRPWDFLSLDEKSRSYIRNSLDIQLDRNGPRGRCSATDYLTVMDALNARFQEEASPVNSFPELSLAAWNYTGENVGAGPETEMPTDPVEPYSIDDILSDGCFIERAELEKHLERLRTKKNLILQGPPGTGKTWLAKRLAFALIGQRDNSKVRAVQFHPNLSYEDFVRGWRPTGEGKLSLVDGPFMEIVKAALRAPSFQYVIVIEEINRGKPAQIFGEMLTLLEADKRTPSEALELCYRQTDDERVHIPENLYVIGTMNIADRSLALVDFAFRRRFAFVDLEPQLGQVWRDWVHRQCGIDSKFLDEVKRRIDLLNDEITADASLGRQFRIGHSFVTPAPGLSMTNAHEWFKQVVDTEIGPLLEEYWFDAHETARSARQRLTEGL